MSSLHLHSISLITTFPVLSSLDLEVYVGPLSLILSCMVQWQIKQKHQGQNVTWLRGGNLKGSICIVCLGLVTFPFWHLDNGDPPMKLKRTRDTKDGHGHLVHLDSKPFYIYLAIFVSQFISKLLELCQLGTFWIQTRKTRSWKTPPDLWDADFILFVINQ